MDLETLIASHTTTLVDVREPYEYDEGHLDGALNIPLAELPAHLAELQAMPGAIILYCNTGDRSRQGVMLLNGLGIPNLWKGGSMEEMEEFMQTME